MNTAKTAPKDGSTFLADMGLPYLVVCMWNAAVDKWVYANPQLDQFEGDWNDSYFENEWGDESELKGWLPMPSKFTINN